MQCPSCSATNPDDARFCQQCGSPLKPLTESHCPRCRQSVPPTARFCSSCGAEISDKPQNEILPDQPGIPHSLQKYLPAGYIERLMATKGRVEGERRIVTILFSDVKGSTALAEQLDPEEVLDIMNRVFEMLIEPITRYEGTLARLMGDAIMAFFGAPIAHEDDPQRACRAALDIIEGAKAMAQTLENERGIKGFNVRVGINTGLVVVAEVGADLRVEYTAMGDAVNLAARMEAMAEPGTILITDATRKALGECFSTHSLGPVTIRGKSDPVSVYRLLGLAATTDPFRPGQLIRSPLVGREAEVTRLNNRVAALDVQDGGICALVGEPGVGKSRLLEEVRAKGASGRVWAEARSLAYTQATSYGTVRQLLTALIGGTPADTPEASRELLQKSVEQISPNVVPEILPYLSTLMGLNAVADAHQRLHALDPELLQQRIQHAVATFLRLQASRRPVVLVWDDFQWIDPSSLAILQYLLPLLGEIPLLCILAYRQGEEPAERFIALVRQQYGQHLDTIPLSPLPEPESTVLLAHLLGNAHLSAETRSEILRRTEGNAFFLEEVARAITESGTPTDVALNDEHAPRASSIRIPDTLRGVIMARIDRLDASDRQVLQTAAVLGRSFDKNLLAAIVHTLHPSLTLETTLHELVRRDFLRTDIGIAGEHSHGHVDGTIHFAHNLTQQVAYDSLLLSQRRTLHQLAAATIEDLSGVNLPPLLRPLALHWEMAGDKQKALLYVSQAAVQARDVSANEEARALFIHALDLATELHASPDHRAMLHHGLADVLAQGAQYREALDHYAQADQSTTDAVQRASIRRKQGIVYERMGSYDESVKALEEALALLRSTADSSEAARIFTGLGRIYSHRGDLQAALDLSLLALDLAQNYNDEWALAQANNNLGIISAKQGELTKALEYHKAALEVWNRINEPQGLAGSHNNLGLVYHRLGDLDEARKQYEASIELSRRTGDQLALARSYDNLSQVLALDGQLSESTEFLEKAVRILSHIGHSEGVTNPELWLQSGLW